MTSSARRILSFVFIGLLGGFFSGLFGVGGGIILVPLLLLITRFPQRLASGTSLAAILPTSIAGTITYASTGSIDWVAGACLAVGAVAGSLLGTWLMRIIRQKALRWMFIIFMLLVGVRMLFLVPDRSFELEISTLTVFALIGVGVVVGVLSGLLGVGGGVIVVPVLMLLFGVSDLIAKGTSLLMMIPTALTGTIANKRNGNVDLRAAAIIGSIAVIASVGGAFVANILPAQLGAVLFGILLLYSAAQLTLNTLRQRKPPAPEEERSGE